MQREVDWLVMHTLHQSAVGPRRQTPARSAEPGGDGGDRPEGECARPTWCLTCSTNACARW
jgi:hypothetical protein